MTGLDKMKNQILDEANTSAKEKLETAKAEAAVLLEEAKAETAALCESISQKSDADVKNYKERVKSSSDLQRKKEILQAKQEVIADVLDKAYEKLQSLDDAAYFGMLEKMLEKFALPQAGEVFFSAADLKRMPEGFAGKVEQIAAAKGGSLVISKEERNLEGGFVLAYGGIEENCTFKAMFEAKKDELSDKVHSLLFL
ncbi:MAG: V-type ATP synthase subunit E [Lachnospiraceae bacterium]|jgi:V/A-type H+-transporting ATPase subunit E